MDKHAIMMRQLKKLRYILTNYCGFLRYGKYKIKFFFNFVFWGNGHTTAFHTAFYL